MNEELTGWVSKKDPDPAVKVKRVTEIFSSLKIDHISTELATSHYEKAQQYLERINVQPERKSPLADFAKDLMNRER